MGCGASRLDPNGEEMPPNLRPLLRRRFEELARLRRGTTLSKKQLLRDDVRVEDDENSSGSTPKRDSASSPNGSFGYAKVAPDPEGTGRDQSGENVDKDITGGKKEKEMAEEEAVAKVVLERAVSDVTDGEGDEDEEDGRRLSNVLVCPGSPSFRVYCLHSMEMKKNIHDHDDDRNKSLPVTVEDDCTVDSSEGSSTKTKKKGNRGRKFRRAIQKGKPVRNLLKVKSCYYPACGSHRHEEPRLIAAKESSS